MLSLEKSIIVAAHPDDEILWFSSILAQVNKIILCYLAVASRKEWTQGRRQVLADYPLPNVSCLALDEAEVFWGVDWFHPVKSEYGLKITDRRLSDTVYRNNFELLMERLRAQLRGYENVFTHNPWGEYGHVEHVQVYRAVKRLQSELDFNLWYTSYVSNKSVHLMAREYTTIGPTAGILGTDKDLATLFATLYKNNNCWTWYDDYEWCDWETFVLDVEDPREAVVRGRVSPLNMIDVGLDPVNQNRHRPWFLGLKLKKKARRLLGQKTKVD